MTVLMFLSILVCLIIVTLFAFCMLMDDHAYDCACMSLFAGIIVIVVFCKLTPSIYKMEENMYRNKLDDKHSCMNSIPEDIQCLEDYKEWLKDSAKAVVNLKHLDSLRTAVKGDISKILNQSADTIKEKTNEYQLG